MTSGRYSREKGARAERAAVAWLRLNGFPHAKRRGIGYPGLDVDELGPGIEFEIKDQAEWNLGGWVDQMRNGMIDTDAAVGAVIVKRAHTSDVGRWWFLTTVEIMANLSVFSGLTAGGAKIGRPRPKQIHTDYHQAVGGAELDGLDIPVLTMERIGRSIPDHYCVTTMTNGLRLVRAAGYGTPLTSTGGN